MTHLTTAGATLLIASLLVPSAYAGPKDQPSSSNDSSIYAELAKAPKKAAARRNPLANDPEAIPAGAKLFALHCAGCHGATAEGGKKGPSLRVPEVQQSSPGTLFWLLTNGVVRKGMPVWSKLPDAQRWQLVAYVKSSGVAGRPTTPESSSP